MSHLVFVSGQRARAEARRRHKTGLERRIPDDLIWQCGGLQQRARALSWQPSRALGLLPLPRGGSQPQQPKACSECAALLAFPSFYTHSQLFLFVSASFSLSPFVQKKRKKTKKSPPCRSMLRLPVESPRSVLVKSLNPLPLLPLPRPSEPHPVMAQQHFIAQCSPLSVKKPFWDRRTAEKNQLSKCSLHSTNNKVSLDKGKQWNIQDFLPKRFMCSFKTWITCFWILNVSLQLSIQKEKSMGYTVTFKSIQFCW